MMKVTNRTFGMMAANRRENRLNSNGVRLCRILKNGKPGKPTLYEKLSGEQTAADVIARLESLNPGSKWTEA